jgi:hypothetical protein
LSSQYVLPPMPWIQVRKDQEIPRLSNRSSASRAAAENCHLDYKLAQADTDRCLRCSMRSVTSHF